MFLSAEITPSCSSAPVVGCLLQLSVVFLKENERIPLSKHLARSLAQSTCSIKGGEERCWQTNCAHVVHRRTRAVDVEKSGR